MPDPRILKHSPALMGEVNVSQYAGIVVMESHATNTGNTGSIGIAASDTSFWDMPAFLHGYGSRAGDTIQDHLVSAWASGVNVGQISMTLDQATDRIKITLSTGSGQHIRIKAGPDNHLLGFENGVDSAGGVTITAPNPWRRGVFAWTQGIDVQIQSQGNWSGITRFPEPFNLHRVQSLMTYMRDRGVAEDSDNVWSDEKPGDAPPLGFCLERRVQNNANPTPEFRAMVEADGRISFNYPNTGSPSATMADSWFAGSSVKRRFAIRLGFDLTETAVAAPGNRLTLTSKNPAPCVLAMDRGYVKLRRTVRNRDDYAQMSDGSIVSAGLAPVRGWEATLRVVGPAYGFDASLEQHLRDWWQHSRRGLTLYPQWGDADYSLGSIDMRRNVTPDFMIENVGPNRGYTTGVSIEAYVEESNYAKRKGGRLFLRQTRSTTYREEYKTELDCYQDIDLRLQDDPTRVLYLSGAGDGDGQSIQNDP